MRPRGEDARPRRPVDAQLQWRQLSSRSRRREAHATARRIPLDHHDNLLAYTDSNRYLDNGVRPFDLPVARTVFTASGHPLIKTRWP